MYLVTTQHFVCEIIVEVTIFTFRYIIQFHSQFKRTVPFLILQLCYNTWDNTIYYKQYIS